LIVVVMILTMILATMHPIFLAAFLPATVPAFAPSVLITALVEARPVPAICVKAECNVFDGVHHERDARRDRLGAVRNKQPYRQNRACCGDC